MKVIINPHVITLGCTEFYIPVLHISKL